MLRPAWFVSLLLLFAISRAGADEVLVLVDEVPAGGVVAARVDLEEAARWCGVERIVPEAVRAFLLADGKPLPVQFAADGPGSAAGMLIMRLPPGKKAEVRLDFKGPKPAEPKPWDGTVTTGSFTASHDAKRMGGLPWRFSFPKTKKVFDSLRWNDRLHHAKLGSFQLRDDTDAQVELISQGPLATVVRVRASYMRGTKQPESRPEATYLWCYFHDRPLVWVKAVVGQREPFAWRELHVLELSCQGTPFPNWIGGEPSTGGKFTGSKKGTTLSRWAALVDDRNTLAMFRCGRPTVYDGLGGFGNYLLAHGSACWKTWETQQQDRSAWLWIASEANPAEAIRAASKAMPCDVALTVTVDTLRTSMQAARAKADKLQGPKRCRAMLQLAGAEQLQDQGRLQEAAQALAGKMPQGWTFTLAGDLGLIVERSEDGLRPVELLDAATGTRLLAPNPLPLFSLTVRDVKTKKDMSLNSDAGWARVEVTRTDRAGLEIHWHGEKTGPTAGLHVTARATPDAKAGALRWTIKVDNTSSDRALRRVVFPQVAVAPPGDQPEVLVPQAAGRVWKNVNRQAFRFGGTYPSGWTSMQFQAVYDRNAGSGLYLARHDPLGGTKDISAQGKPEERAVVLSFDHPAADMDRPGNDFTLSGEAVWQVLRGDWFDASMIYRDWVRKHAKWYPTLSAEGRADTPKWMRELPAWALSGGGPKSCVEDVLKFREYLGVPVGFHWYSWHKIPFDNDYPHYFPTKEGFTEAVARLQGAGVYVMPYINGRLWDTRDRGSEDFEFTRLALPAASKDEEGKPYLESYSSKESDGTKVKLAAMCPTTELWQKTVRDIVLKLMNECGVKGVYIDQVAAAKPRLCFDRSHGHPTGGGHWWTTAGYWPMMEKLRQAMPKDRMLTTECNAEPYIKWFDGYLSWHWQYDGQVPAFPAVYGGSIQMFGRAYRAGPTKDLALRMKAGQQLVYGEQIGWLHPSVVREKQNAAFLRQVVRLRWRFRRYFHAGEMARPPRLIGTIPDVTADWQWRGEWPVTTKALMSGAWRLPAENRLLLLFVNVSERPISARLDINTAKYGLPGGTVHVEKSTESGLGDSGLGEKFDTPSKFTREITFPARTAWVWEVTPSPASK